MKKTPNGVYMAIIVALAALLVVGLIVILFFSTTGSGGRQTIALPEQTAAQETADVPETESQSGFAEVTAANVAKTLDTLQRPECYHQILSVETFWDTQSSVRTAEIWKMGDCFRISVTLTGNQKKYYLSDGTGLWVWYEGDRQAFETTLGALGADDDLLGIPTYETVKNLPESQILDAGTVTLDDFGGAECVYVQTRQDQTVCRYWISLESGLLLKADSVADDSLTYQMQQQSLEQLTAADAAFSAVLVLPDGTALTAAQTQSPQAQ